jgi:hypothetical protein
MDFDKPQEYLLLIIALMIFIGCPIMVICFYSNRHISNSPSIKYQLVAKNTANNTVDNI